MDWLAQNWIWIAAAIGGFFLFTRMGVGGCGMGGCGMGGSTGNSRGSGNNGGAGRGAVFDPVNRHALPAGAAISSVYQGRAYYFENRENRDAFESDPDKYLAGSSAVGQAIASEDASADWPRRAGCC